MSEELIKEHLRKWESFKIEFLDQKNTFFQLDSTIESVGNDSIIISSPKFGGEEYYLPVDSEVSLAFYRRDGILHSHTRVLARQSGSDARLKICYPYNTELIDRRRSKRVRLGLKIQIEYYLNKNSFNKKILNEVTYDISSTGLCYISNEPLGKYAKIKCNIYLNPNYSEPIQPECKFVYSRKKQVNSETVYYTALEFIKISREDYVRLQEKCYRSFYDSK